jgi:hypothetical protein
MKPYVTNQGDFWDVIGLRCYEVGGEHLMHRLIEANYEHRKVVQFSGGIRINVPEVERATEVALVPWKNAFLVT